MLALLLAAPATSRSDEAEEPGKLAAVQRRKFRMDHEIFAAAQFMPLDAFYKGIGPVAGYTIHFTDVIAWEVVRGGYSFTLNTSLRDQLEKDFGVAPTKFTEMQWMVSSAAMFTPFYGKLSLVNSAVTHAEIFAVVGATVAKFNDAYRPGPQGGVGLRFFLSERVSIRFDVRYHYLFSSNPAQLVDLSLGLALNLGGSD